MVNQAGLENAEKYQITISVLYFSLGITILLVFQNYRGSKVQAVTWPSHYNINGKKRCLFFDKTLIAILVLSNACR